MSRWYALTVNRSLDVLALVLDKANDEVAVTLEGDLSRADFSRFPHVIREPLVSIPPDSTWRIVTFLLDAQRKHTFQRTILTRIGIRKHVAHIQIAQHGSVIFSSSDWFCDECAWISAEIVSEPEVQLLVQHRVIRSYSLRAE